MNNEQSNEQITDEQHWYREYVRLGEVARDAEAERKQIRDEYIEPGMADGVVYGEGEKALTWSFETRADFAWERAAADGKINLSELKDYCEVSVRRVLRATKQTEDEAAASARVNAIRAAAPDLVAKLGAFLNAGDPQDKEAALTALCLSYDAIGSDAVTACVEAVAKAAKKGKK